MRSDSWQQRFHNLGSGKYKYILYFYILYWLRLSTFIKDNDDDDDDDDDGSWLAWASLKYLSTAKIKVDWLDWASWKYGLEINIDKTKIMKHKISSTILQ